MRYLYRKDFYILRFMVTTMTLLFLIFTMVLSGITPVWASRLFPNLPDEQIDEFRGDFDWDLTLTPPSSASDYIVYSDFRDNYCLFDTSISTCQSAVNGKYIRIDTAEDLYRFSVDVSYEDFYITGDPVEDKVLSWDKKAFLLSLYYKLGNNIDYSVMGAKTFISIGYHLPDASSYDVPSALNNLFTGTFDGQGFTISNLYVAGYQYLIYEDNSGSTTEYIPTTEYYAMFNYNMGTIQNFGLIDPTLEVLQYVEDMHSIATLVGYNIGTSSQNAIVDHVYVIDTRTSVYEAGLRYNIGTISEDVKAAGMVHTNGQYGVFTNAYFVSILVVNAYYFNKIDGQPVLYYNYGTISQLAFDDTVYLETVLTYNIEAKNGLATSETTTMLKSGTDSVLNDLDDRWHFYASDSYPILLGFESEGGYFLINDAIDFVFFSRALSFITKYDAVHEYKQANYRLTNDIDLSTLAPGAYKTSSATFEGTLTGLIDESHPDYPENPEDYTYNDNFYIYNLDISTGIIRNNVYYAGLFSILGSSSSVNNINFSDVSISLTDTESYYSYPFYIGLVAGRNSAGTLENIITHTDVSIYLGDDAIGETHVGGLVGQSSGLISHVQVSGTLDAGIHTISSSYTITPRIYIGGIVGTAITNQLRIEEAVHQGTITGFSTTSTPAFSSGYTNYQLKMGGIIGYLYNTSSVKHQLLNVSNKGSIIIRNISDSTTPDPTQHIGGVFGELEGNAPTLEDAEENYLFANLHNEGNFTATYATGVAIVRVAGIGVNNASEHIEYALLSNGSSDGSNGHFTLNSEPTATTNNLFKFTGIIFDVGSTGVTLSRVYNHANLNYSTGYSTYVSPLYYSLSNTSSTIRYSSNYGNISLIKSDLSSITISNSFSMSGISSSSNISYLNVFNYGIISVVNVNIQGYSLFVSGIARELSQDNYMKNSVNYGEITVAKITSRSTLWTAVQTDSSTRNIFIAGLVNINKAGDLQSFALDADNPVAEEGIINCINHGEITSSYLDEEDELYGIIGMGNTLAAGIATLNAGSIQNSANLSKIGISSLTSPDTGYTAQTQSYSYTPTAGSTYSIPTNVGYNSIYTDAYKAGRMIYVNSGVIVAGITAASISGNARVYDTANNGDIIGISYAYVRAGGILGISLKEELDAIGITSDLGYTDTPLISTSVLSNGLNFGNVSAITDVKSIYTTNAVTVYATSYTASQNMLWLYLPGSTTRLTTGYYPLSIYESTIRGSEERPAIFASAGGVIAYGLAVMRRMLNHGTISGTDVAGGIIGATYVIGGSSGGTVKTYININTAINYGDIEVISTSSIGNISKHALDHEDIANEFLTGSARTDILFPYAIDLMRRSPGTKPGYGGIIGRLQRGSNGEMEPTDPSHFQFIVNVNKDIDLIGRIDQVFNWTASNSAYLFSSAKGNYYSARTNDSTQVVFTGYYYAYAYLSNQQSLGNYKYTYTVDISRYYEIMGKNATQITYTGTNPLTNFVAGQYAYSDSTPSGRYVYLYIGPIDVPWITEDPSETLNDEDEWLYDENFPIRDELNNLDEFIYYMPNILLADKFSQEWLDEAETIENPQYREFGMYVLSTSAGSDFGLAIPANIDIFSMRSIDETSTITPSLLNINYESVSGDYLNDLSSVFVNDYNSLRQTKYNEKSLLIESSSTYFNLDEYITGNYYDEVLYEGSSVELINGDINDTTAPWDITFTISVDAFMDNQTTAQFSISQAFSSAYSLIAVSPEVYYGGTPTEAQLKALNDLLVLESGLGVSQNYAPELSVTIPSRDIVSATEVYAGEITVYSEAFVNDDTFWESQYYTTYDVYINFLPSISQLPGVNLIDYVYFNGSSVNVNYDTATAVDVTGIGNVNYNGTIAFDFYDTKGVFTPGFDFINNIELYYLNGSTPVLVDEDYYVISSTPAEVISNIGYYSFSLDFTSAQLKAGNYVIYYKYYPSMDPYTITFDKTASNQTSINDFTYYSESGSVEIVGTSITSLINFGYPLSLNTSIDSSSTGAAVYLTQTTYWAQYMTDESMILSPFATLTSVTIGTPTYSGTNYRQYLVTYRITAEDGTTYSDYSHTITERTVSVESVFKNNNEANIDDLYAAREDEVNTFEISLGFDSTLDLYRLAGSYPYLVITYSSLVDPIEGISHYVEDDSLFVAMTYESLPGDYDIIIEIYQDATTVVLVDTLTITKNQGIDAYIKDIKFSSATTIVEYPIIRVTDEDGIDITTEYDPRVYFDGIDYDGADIGDESIPYDPENYFRIDGAVSNTPLDQYVPNIVEYLPYGASVALGTWDTNTQEWVFGTPVKEGDSLQPLVANFTIDPKTGNPGDNVKIPYKVVSESNPNNWVIYYITVTDKTYNVTINFNIFYCSDTPEVCESVTTADEFEETLFMITVKNYIVYDNDVLVEVLDYDGNTNPALFPSFDEARTLNNQMVQFYYPNTVNHEYKLGRNRAGFFTFDLALPRDAYLNPLYTFEILHDNDTYTLDAANSFDSRLVGYYYYIGKAEYNRTANFNIYIRKVTPSTEKPWGLYDFFRSWFQE